MRKRREFDYYVGPSVESQADPGVHLHSSDSAKPRLEDGKEMEIEVQEPETERYVTLRGIVHRDSENYPDADIVWNRTDIGFREEKPWAIEVIEEITDEEPVVMEKKPPVRVAYGGRKGRMLADMLRERDDKLKK